MLRLAKSGCFFEWRDEMHIITSSRGRFPSAREEAKKRIEELMKENGWDRQRACCELFRTDPELQERVITEDRERRAKHRKKRFLD